jgi:GNAT superfamily N-acetyltransferase
MVRVHLADALEDGGVDALGLWVDGQLAGLVAWRVEPAGPSGTSICRSIVLAVQNGHVRRGYGRRLKEDMIERAREDGAAAVVSIVHWDNNAMISLNVVLGANVERIDGDPDHCNCVIAL